MYRRYWICLTLIPYLVISVMAASLATSLSVSQIKDTGKVLFRALRDSECKIKCKSRKTRIMCGSDGVSYLSKCEVKRARRCEGKNITIKKKGKCAEADVPMTKCFQEKEEALTTMRRDGAKDVFISKCSSDGTFAEVQCHKASNYCWCVTKEGKPIPGTSINGGKPNCNPKDNSKTADNSNTIASPKTGNLRTRNERRKDKKGKVKRKRKRKRCSSQDRTRFNSNLVRIFTEEYNRSIKASPRRQPNNLDPIVDTLEKQVVEWKFTQYDENNDNNLQRKEVNGLRRLVKKFMKPKECAKRFLKNCDSDRNRLIKRGEWSLCLGVDINNDQVTKATPEPDDVKPTGESLDLNSLLNKKPSSPSKSGEIERPTFPSLPIGLGDFPRQRPASKTKQDKQPNDCKAEQRIAREQEADNPDGNIFIPNCTPEGKWTPAQCHTSTRYCWCVEENTGRPITGTSTHGINPKCDFADGEREIPGCKYAEKQSFLSDLLNTLTAEMADYALNNSTDRSMLVADPNQGIHERAVRWKFTMLDTNRDNDLEISEMDVFKSTSLKNAQKKYTRKCARRFVGYCDESSNKNISMDEWINCMGIKKSSINTNLPSNPKRTGKNPFDQYLRDT